MRLSRRPAVALAAVQLAVRPALAVPAEVALARLHPRIKPYLFLALHVFHPLLVAKFLNILVPESILLDEENLAEEVVLLLLERCARHLVV